MSEVEGRAFEREELIERIEGDEELLAEIVALFLDDAPAQIALVQSALSKGAAVEARRAAHGLKGAASNVGAARVSQAAKWIERHAEAGELEDASRISAELPGELRRFTEAVAASGLLPNG